MLLTEKTRQEKLQKKRSIFGLGVTSLIAACSAATDTDNNATAGYVKPPPGDVGTIPFENLTPTASPASGAPEESTTRTEYNGGITATYSGVPLSTDGQPTRNTVLDTGIDDVGILIDLKNAMHPYAGAGNANQVLEGAKTVTFHIRNGNHAEKDGNKAALTSASLYKVANTSTYDLVVSSPEFGNDAGNELTGGVYIYWDIAGSIKDTVNAAQAATDATESIYDDHSHVEVNITNYLEVKGLAGNDAIAQDAPQFFHIGGSNSAQYDMVVRSNVTAGTGAIYILWDVAAYAGATKGAASKTVNFAGANNTDINATYGLLAIKGASAGDNIGAGLLDILRINNNLKNNDMIIKSATNIYILWDITEYYTTDATEITLADASAATHGLLTISGGGGFNTLQEANGSFLVDVLKIKNDQDYDMIIRSDTDMYILWDVAKYYHATDHKDINLTDGSATNGLLTISGGGAFDVLKNPDGSFLVDVLKINNNDDYDMIIRSDTEMYILWDVAKYYSATDHAKISLDSSATHGLLTISGGGAFGILKNSDGRFLVDVLKINNNNDYDMIIKADTDIYILWDVANYYHATDHVEISLTDVSATNGLLTISGAGDFNILQEANGRFLDINDSDNGDNNINDIVLTDGSNTFILFGEQLAYRDKDNKAVSDTVDMAKITAAFTAADTDAGFFTYDEVVTPTTKADLEGIVGYRFASAETDIGTVEADYEVIAVANRPGLSDADAGVGVWDIA